MATAHRRQVALEVGARLPRAAADATPNQTPGVAEVPPPIYEAVAEAP